MVTCERGFSLLEALVATALMLAATSAAFSMMHPAHGAFATEPERSDMQQRLRVGAAAIAGDLRMAGAGANRGSHAGSLAQDFPPVLPFRIGPDEDPTGAFTADCITLVYVPSAAAQTTSDAPLSGASPAFSPSTLAGCPLDPATASPAALCGFAKDRTVLVLDGTGRYGLYTVVAASGATLTLSAMAPASGATFPAGSRIVEAEVHAYYLRSNTSQLMHHDGQGSAAPVIDNVVGLHFDYYGEQLPEAGGALASLTGAELTDGPFRPDAADAQRWDADLLRIRRIGVTLRVQTAVAALRGPAGALFARAGSSHGGMRWVPDQETHFDVSPRNLNLAR